MEDCPEHRALRDCYDRLVSGMVARDILPKFFARDFVTDYEKQEILGDVVTMDANEKLLKAVLRQGGHVVVYLCRVLFEVKLKELGWRLYHALKTHSVDVSEIRNLSKMGHFRHPVNVIVLSGLQVKLASLLARVQSACEKIPFSSIRRFTVTILCNYQLIQDSVEMEKIQTLDALFDRLSIALKWHWYDPLSLIIDYVDSPQLKEDLKTFGSCVKEFTEKKLTECSSLVESLTRLPSNGEFLETVLDVDPEAAEVQDILRSQEFLKLLGVSAALFVGERNSKTTLFWWIPRVLVGTLMLRAISAIREMKAFGVAELRVSGYFRIVASIGTCTYYESPEAFDVDDATLFKTILDNKEMELSVAQQAVSDANNREMSLRMKAKKPQAKDELQNMNKHLSMIRQRLNESEKQRKAVEEEKRKIEEERDELKRQVEELQERCSKGKQIAEDDQHQGEQVETSQHSSSDVK